MFGQKNKNKKHCRYNIHHYEWKRKRDRKIVFYIVMLMFFVGSLSSFGNLTKFRISILPIANVPAFNGTVYPVKQVPNWSKLNSGEWDLNYESLNSKLTALPKYDPEVLKIPMDSLKYNNPADDAVRNAKLTYPVPYLGGYKLDGLENSGSHPAIDIKMPIGTPVYSIANGVVSKTANPTTGFGKHIVILHPNVPFLTNQNQKTTLHSAYAHLDQISVSEGDIVLKGQQIGLSGNSGLSSAPHLHFQIDTDDAPFHPYWPFTYKDIADAGLKTFNNAVNAGLGRESARAMTINSMNYVQKYLSYAAVENLQNANPQNVNPPVDNINTPVQPPAGNTTTAAADLAFKITGKASYMWNEGVVLTITIHSGDSVYTGNLLDVVSLSLTNSSIGMLDKTTFIASDFTNGAARVSIINPSPGKSSVILGYQGKKFYSNEFEISSSGFNPRERVIFTDDIRSDLSGSYLFADISSTFPSYAALQYLKNKGIINGYEDNTFRPEQVVSRAEALKLILETSGASIKNPDSIPFSDIKLNDWFAKYVMTAFSDNIVKGYSNGTFKPANTVNKIEFLKMLLIAMKIDVNPLVASAPYNDVPLIEWYAPYVNFAKEKNLVNVLGGNFGPSEGMKRKDVADVVYRVMILKETGADKYTEGLASAG